MRTGSPLPGVQEFLLTNQRWEGEKPRFHPALTVPSAGEALRLLRERRGRTGGWLGLGLLGVVEYLRGQRMQLGLQGTGGFRTGNPTSHSAGLSELEEASDPHCPPFRRKQPLGPSPIMMQKRGKVPLALITYPVCHP